MFKKQACLIAGIIFLTGTVPVHAFDWFGGRLSIGGGYGRAKPRLPNGYHDSHEEGEMWTGHLKYFLNNDLSVVASYADLQPHRRDDKTDFQRLRPIVGSLRYNIFHHLPFTPYITGGAGYAINKREAPGIKTKWEGFTYQAGLGVEFFITEGASLGIEGLYHHFEADGDNHPYRLGSAVGMVNFYFGSGPSQKRAEEALKKEQAEAERVRAEAEKAKADALAAQQAAAQAQQGQSTAMLEATVAQQAAAAAQVQAQNAQAEMDHIKQMVASKEIPPISFKTGSTELAPSSNATLDKVAEITKKYPALKLRIEGHTDSTGSKATNERLSQKRADSVRDYLTDNGGVPTAQISSAGFGPTRPIASNDTPDGRAQNRRVEFIFQLPQ